MRNGLAVFLLVGCLPSVLFGQGGATGAISGTVKEQSSAVLAGARVEVSGSAGTVRHLETNSDGSFTAPLLGVGTYTIVISAPGFA